MDLKKELQKKIDQKTKPIGALGLLEKIAFQVGCIQNSLNPVIQDPHIFVFAADHGIAVSGIVNPYPQEVTAQMVYNFINGGAAINVFCRYHNIGLSVIDAGVCHDFSEDLPLKRLSLGKGTRDYSRGEAMKEQEVHAAIEKGRMVIKEIAASGSNCVGIGEMGIGNSSSAALILHHYTKLPINECAGRGTGVDDEQLKNKLRMLDTVSDLHQLKLNTYTPVELLSRVGGFEIAMMTGAYLEAKNQGMIIVADGFISTAALMVAYKIEPTILENCIFAHCSEEQGHRLMLAYLKAIPILQLGMRLGEGTGAALAVPLIQSAVAFLNEMASFDSAGISRKD